MRSLPRRLNKCQIYSKNFRISIITMHDLAMQSGSCFHYAYSAISIAQIPVPVPKSKIRGPAS